MDAMRETDAHFDTAHEREPQEKLGPFYFGALWSSSCRTHV